MRSTFLFGLSVVIGCSASGGGTLPDAAVGGPDAAADVRSPDGDSPDAASDAAPDAPSSCSTVTDAADVQIAIASASGEQVLTFDATSAKTMWNVAGNEALILEIDKNGVLLGHVILHQGQTSFGYGLHVGALSIGDVLTARVSSHSAQNAIRKATVCAPALTTSASMGAIGEGIDHAPIWVWPLAKSFDDVPLVVGWSAKSKTYDTYFTNENGGVTETCGGGGASGLAEEVRLWGRECDIETDYSYQQNTFQRCTGTTTSTSLRFQGTHPTLYYGNGHNNAFEDRSGYASTCGIDIADAPDAPIAGWGAGNQSAQDDAKYSLILRPIPVASDASTYGFGGMPRERVLAQSAPWLFRLADLEAQREGKMDDKSTFPFNRYLHADVYVADVDGSTTECPLTLVGGFKLRAHTTNGQTSSSGQITNATCPNEQWKHVSVPLDMVHVPGDVDQLDFDAYNGDGIYLLGIGDVYLLEATGDNGAIVASVRTGSKQMGQYVDDDSSGCNNGQNVYDNVGYPCVGGDYKFAP